MADHERHIAELGTRTWLDGELASGIAARSDRRNGFYADGRPARMVEAEFRRLVRQLRIFRQLHRLSFESLLDVGSGNDVYPYLARQRFGVEAYFSDFVHQSNLPT